MKTNLSFDERLEKLLNDNLDTYEDVPMWWAKDMVPKIKTEMKEAMMEIIGSDAPEGEEYDDENNLIDTGYDKAKAEQRQRVNEFFEED